MRAILNVSLPAEKKSEIEKQAKKAGMTVSTYILWAVEFKEKLISEDELAERIRAAEKNYRAGKAKKLKSLADLL